MRFRFLSWSLVAGAISLCCVTHSFGQVTPTAPAREPQTTPDKTPTDPQMPGEPGHSGYVPGFTGAGPVDKDPVATSGVDRDAPSGNKINDDSDAKAR